MAPSDDLIETGVFPSGHPYARIGTGSRLVLSIPGLSFTAEPAKPAAIRRSWKRWLEPIERHGLTVIDVGRRADLPPGSSTADIADDYAAVIREHWGSAVGVTGLSTGGGYAPNGWPAGTPSSSTASCSRTPAIACRPTWRRSNAARSTTSWPVDGGPASR